MSKYFIKNCTSRMTPAKFHSKPPSVLENAMTDVAAALSFGFGFAWLPPHHTMMLITMVPSASVTYPRPLSRNGQPNLWWLSPQLIPGAGIPRNTTVLFVAVNSQPPAPPPAAAATQTESVELTSL